MLSLLEFASLSMNIIIPRNLPVLTFNPLNSIIIIPIFEETVYRLLWIGIFGSLSGIFSPKPNSISSSDSFISHRWIDSILLVITSFLFSVSHFNLWGDLSFLYYFFQGFYWDCYFCVIELFQICCSTCFGTTFALLIFICHIQL